MSAANPPPNPPRAIPLLPRPAVIAFFDVIQAILLREVRTRFATTHIGYLRALLEPLVLVVGFGGVFYFLNRAVPIAVPLSLFLITGVCPWIAFSRSWNAARNSIEANKALLAFPIVRPIDFFVARGLLELSTQVLVFSLLALGIHGYEGDIQLLPDNLLGVIGAYVVIVGLGCVVGLAFACISIDIPNISLLEILIQRVMFFTSGIFYIADSLPQLVRDVVWWNPLLHATELLRSSYFSEMDSYLYDPFYLFGFVGGVLALALVLEKRVAKLRRF